MIPEIYHNISYFLGLTKEGDVLWIALPLLIATIIMLVYFERYKDERPEWNTYVANSLVFLFVSFILFRYIYGLEGDLYSFVNYLDKFIVSLMLLLVGVMLLFFNFTHALPERIAGYASSLLTLNLIAYICVLYVYSEIQSSPIVIFSLLIMFIGLLLIFNTTRVFTSRLLKKMKEMKSHEKRERVILEKGDILRKKKEIEKEEIGVRKKRRGLEKEERRVVREMLKKLDEQKREAIFLKKLAKK